MPLLALSPIFLFDTDALKKLPGMSYPELLQGTFVAQCRMTLRSFDEAKEVFTLD